MEVNGSQISIGALVFVMGVVFTGGALQWQVINNTKEIEKLDDAPTQIAVLQTTQDSIKDELKKIEAHTAAQTQLLNQAVRQLAEINAKQDE